MRGQGGPSGEVQAAGRDTWGAVCCGWTDAWTGWWTDSGWTCNFADVLSHEIQGPGEQVSGSHSKNKPETLLRDTGTWGRGPLMVTHSAHKALETQEQVSRPFSYTDPAFPYRALETQNMARRRVPCLAPRALCAPVKCSPRVSVQMSPGTVKTLLTTAPPPPEHEGAHRAEYSL